jgi:hypothetical protein
LILVLERRFDLPRVCHRFKQENFTLSLDDLMVFITLGIQSPIWLGVARELPRIVVESQDVCIALLFMGIDSEEWLALVVTWED